MTPVQRDRVFLWAERAAILEHCAGIDRAQAERDAAADQGIEARHLPWLRRMEAMLHA